MHIGVDEAGRGPVLGSMFVGAVGVPDSDMLPVEITDSKQLSAAKREQLAETIQDDPRIVTTVVEVSVETIDAMAGRLNHLTAQRFGAAISNVIDPAQPVETVIVDACDPNVDRFASAVGQALPDSIDIDAHHGADESSSVVGAASIVAKVARDAHMSSLGTTYGDIGSGYPSDPTTRTFLSTYVEEHGRLPGCARKSWRTSRDAMAAHTQGTLSSF